MHQICLAERAASDTVPCARASAWPTHCSKAEQKQNTGHDKKDANERSRLAPAAADAAAAATEARGTRCGGGGRTAGRGWAGAGGKGHRAWRRCSGDGGWWREGRVHDVAGDGGHFSDRNIEEVGCMRGCGQLNGQPIDDSAAGGRVRGSDGHLHAHARRRDRHTHL